MVKVDKVIINAPFFWRTDNDGSHILRHMASMSLQYCHRGLDCVARIRFFGESTDGIGFRCDGLTVPPFFRWFLPSWSVSNMLYNASGALHDWLYATKGNFGEFDREECDDFFRGVLRESGIGRFRAGCADKAIEWFAGGKGHWGNDDYDVSRRAMMEITKSLS